MILEDTGQVGVDEPFYIYLTCLRVLAATHDARALSLLQTAHALLERYANRITDARLRRSFLENVPIHQALWEAYAQDLIRGVSMKLTPGDRHLAENGSTCLRDR